MPITSRCNSRCKTCNVWRYKKNVDIDSSLLKEVLKSSFYSEVKAVGINGGEFTLNPNFMDVFQTVLSMPSLSSIYLISNGLSPKRLFQYLQNAMELCKSKNVYLHIALSVDGVGAVHDTIRGIPNCFSKTKEILDELYHNRDKYCNNFSVICTLSKDNIAYVRETEQFFDNYDNLEVEYQLAVPNQRIRTFNDYERYYVLSCERTKRLTAEFFYERYKSSLDWRIKRQSFVIYKFLINNGVGRLCKCNYLDRDVTIDENLDLSLCATASNIVGNLRKNDSLKLMKSKIVKTERNRISKVCNKCIHYSENELNFMGRIVYIHETIHDMYILQWYDVACQKNMLMSRKFYSFVKNLVYDYLKLVHVFL